MLSVNLAASLSSSAWASGVAPMALGRHAIMMAESEPPIAADPMTMGYRKDIKSEAAVQGLKDLAFAQNPAIGYFDPLGLSSVDFTGEGAESTVGFLRHAEIKHGRVAMAGFIGYIVHENGIRWPWALTTADPDYTSFAGLSAPAVWDALPEASKYQIIGVIGCLEIWSENSAVLERQGTTHYMRGGKPGFFPAFKGQSLPELKSAGAPEGKYQGSDYEGPTALFPSILHPVPFNLYDPFNFSKNMSPEKKVQRLNMEVNNGRLAMIGLAGFISEASIPGSVPFLAGRIQPYVGDVMQPFEPFA